MRTEYIREVNQSYLVLEREGMYRADYQMRMLTENQIPGLLSVRGQGVDDKSRYVYEIGGKIPMKALYEKAKIRGEEMRAFLQQFCQILHQVRLFLLDVNCLLLDPEYIFFEKEQFYFCYYPPEERPLTERFRTLTEYLVSETDYEDQDAICMACELHKGAMEDNYSLEKLILELGRQSEQEEHMPEDEISYDAIRQEDAVYIKEEPERLLFGRRKKKKKEPKWGDWDDLYIEEDDL